MMRLTLAACALVLSAVPVPAQPVTVIGPITPGNCAAFNSTTVLRDGGGCSVGGTVTSVATASPLSGGPITTTGTISCPTCATAFTTLSSGLPLIGNGGQSITIGGRSGDTTTYVTLSGPATSGRCAQFDATGNLGVAAASCEVIGSNPLAVGSSLYPNITAPITTTANSTNGSADIVVASAAGLVAGMVTDGSTFQVGCMTAAAAFRSSYITNIVGTTVTMSCPSTATQTGGAITFGHARYNSTSALLANSAGFGNVYVGAASQGNTAAWLPQVGTGQSFLDAAALQVVVKPGGLWGGVFAGRTSDANGNTTFPITCLYLADSGAAVGGECQYTQSNLYAATNNLSSHIQHEYSINSNWTAVEMDPYAVQPTNSTRHVRWDCGTGSFSPAPNDCSAVADILTNGAKYKAVFVVGDGALDTAAGRIAPFAALPQNVSVTWYSAAATRAADIYGALSGGFPVLRFGLPANGTFSFMVAGAERLAFNTAQLYPNTNNTFTMGDASLRFSNVYSVLANFSGGVTASGLPTSAGGGGLTVCVDTAGVLYKKATCP